MATYKEIQEDVRKVDGRVVKTCWISHVKELNGFSLRHAPNRQTPGVRVYPCPQMFGQRLKPPCVAWES